MDLSNLYNKPIETRTAQSTAPLSSYFSPKETAAPVTPPKYLLKDRGVHVTDDDFKALRPLIYGEVSNRDASKKKLEASVILNTAINRAKEYAAKGQPRSLAEVLAMENQYQAYGGPQYKMYSNPTDPIALKKKLEVDAIMNEIESQIKSGTYQDNTEGAYYYIHHPDGRIEYDNKRQLFAK